MPSVKRSHSSSPDHSRTPSSEPISSAPISSAKKPKASPKSGSKKRANGSTDGSPAKRVRVNWAPEEDIIILDLLKDLAKEHLWTKIKEDGRLVHRGNNGIKVHFESMMSKIIKAQGQGGKQ